MYSPFLDRNGNTLTIQKVRYAHLSQLTDCEEGHHLEFKRILEDNEKAQLAKEIASFANCEGGWLIVGIDDKSKEITAIPKFDYSQKVGKIASRISPMPEFETRFISLPEDNSQGVLLIYVKEGRNAPYICNGSIYVRSGSSKEPIKAADRGNVEYLIERSKMYEKSIDDFCKRDYYYYHDNLLHQKTTYPIACIYLKNNTKKDTAKLSTYKNRDKIIDFVTSGEHLFENIQYSMDSIIFRHSNPLPDGHSITGVFELYYDLSCKIYVPLYVKNIDSDLSAFPLIESIAEKITNATIIDGDTSTNMIFAFLTVFCRLTKQYNLKEKDYSLCVDFENIENSLLAFNGEKYIDYVKNYGLPYAQKECNRSHIYHLGLYPKFKFKALPSTIIDNFLCAAFGYRSQDYYDIWMQSSYNRFL